MKYSPRPFERLLTRFIARQTKIIEQLINQFISDATAQTTRVLPQGIGDGENKDFFFRDYPALSRQIDTLLRGLSSRLTKTIEAGCEWSWDLANAKNDNMLSKVLESIGRERVPLKALERWSQKNLPALAAFEKRRIGGMNLSDKVWAYTKGIKGDLELALDIGIGQGMSADRLSRVVREYLKEPDRLYRRVRDEKGVLRLSKSASNYHPGQGVYRSSYKNAVRLTATETNMAYRTADNERMNQMEWILGYEVHISDTNHTCLDSHGVPQPFYDICDELQGRYPKWFVFKGWHPNCYDEESEVYTSNGWKRFADVKSKDLILTINPYSFDLEWSPFKYAIKSQYKGKMIHFFNRSYDALITPDHEVLGLDKNIREPIFMRTTAEKCGKTRPIYRSSEWVGNYITEVKIGDLSVPYALFAEFMGYWLSDGNLGHKWAVVIAQQDEHKKAIYDCIAAMGMKPRYNDKSGKVEFNNKDWYIYLQQFGTCADKFIPQEIKDATPDQIQIFLDAFISCDGYIKKPRSFVGNRGGVCNPTEGERVYFTSSKRMADELGELILKIGRRPSFKIGSKKGTVSQFKNGVYATNYDCWTISECRSKTVTQYNKEEIDYNGWVYDLVLEKNATMYIRRNGKCFWGSNCRCYITTILPEREEMINYLAAMDENGKSSYKLTGEVTEMPKQFNEWVADNTDRIEKAQERGKLPYFLRDNPTAWNLDASVQKEEKPILLSGYTTAEQVRDTVKAIGEGQEPPWFHNGAGELGVSTRKDANGYTTRSTGDIYLEKPRLEGVISAFDKIAKGKAGDITYQEADAMATYWHEITHNRTIATGSAGSSGSQSRRFMELANEYIARQTLPDFYRALGVEKMPFPELMASRASTGYNRMVKNYDGVISLLNLDKDKVTASVMDGLFNGREYNKQKESLVQGLLDGGLRFANGAKPKKGEVNKILSECLHRFDVESMERYLRAVGFIH